MASTIPNVATQIASVYKGGADVCFVVCLICFVEALTWIKQEEGGGGFKWIFIIIIIVIVLFIPATSTTQI